MKTYKNQSESLDIAIAHLELEKKIKGQELLLQLTKTYESIKPINILKQSLEDFKESSEVQTSLLQTVLSVTGGYLTKKIVIGKSNSVFKKIFGFGIQYIMTKYLSSKSGYNNKFQGK